MAAHVPRRIFAPSFVVTLAALPACDRGQTTPPNPPPSTVNPPAPTESAPPTPTASVTATATATATGGLAVGQEWSVSFYDNKCHASVTCPPNDKCNPPAPTDYVCPKDIPNGSYPITVALAAGSHECKAEYTVFSSGGTCPPGMHCNPPPPRHVTTTVPCPKN